MWEMSESLEEILSTLTGVEQTAGGKVMDLSQAVRRFVEPRNEHPDGQRHGLSCGGLL